MDRHIETLLNRLSYVSFAIATLTLILVFLQTPETCVPHHMPHHKFPKSTCDFSHRSLTSIEKKNKRLWSTKAWKNNVQSFTDLFNDVKNAINNHSKVICVSAGGGQEVMALNNLGVKDVTGVEIVDSPPLVRRADPHNLPFFDGAFDVGFSAHFDQALFPRRFVEEMERIVRTGGVCVLVVEESGDSEVGEIVKLFKKSRFVNAKNVSLVGIRMTRIVLRISHSR